jgi:hypothetical protein
MVQTIFVRRGVIGLFYRFSDAIVLVVMDFFHCFRYVIFATRWHLDFSTGLVYLSPSETDTMIERILSKLNDVDNGVVACIPWEQVLLRLRENSRAAD